MHLRASPEQGKGRRTFVGSNLAGFWERHAVGVLLSNRNGLGASGEDIDIKRPGSDEAEGGIAFLPLWTDQNHRPCQ